MRAAYDAAAPRAPLTEHSASKVRGPTLSAPRDVYMCRRAASGWRSSKGGCSEAEERQNFPDLGQPAGGLGASSREL